MKSTLLLAHIIALVINTPLKNNLSAERRSSPIDGAWKLVWAKSNGTQIDVEKNQQIKFFADGCFSLIASNADGKIDYVGYGTFELNGTEYSETFLFHNVAQYVGAKDWQHMEIKGDTLFALGFKKVIVQDQVKDFPVIEEKRVRMP